MVFVEGKPEHSEKNPDFPTPPPHGIGDLPVEGEYSQNCGNSAPFRTCTAIHAITKVRRTKIPILSADKRMQNCTSYVG